MGTNRDTDLFIIHLLHFIVRLPCPVKMAAGNIFQTTLACQLHSSKGERSVGSAGETDSPALCRSQRQVTCKSRLQLKHQLRRGMGSLLVLSANLACKPREKRTQNRQRSNLLSESMARAILAPLITPRTFSCLGHRHLPPPFLSKTISAKPEI